MGEEGDVDGAMAAANEAEMYKKQHSELHRKVGSRVCVVGHRTNYKTLLGGIGAVFKKQNARVALNCEPYHRSRSPGDR
eukprot:352587-Chlamydomonas_euryale.AAC.4